MLLNVHDIGLLEVYSEPGADDARLCSCRRKDMLLLRSYTLGPGQMLVAEETMRFTVFPFCARRVDGKTVTVLIVNDYG